MREESSFRITLAWLISSWSASSCHLPQGSWNGHTPSSGRSGLWRASTEEAQDPCARGCAVYWAEGGKGQLDIDGEGGRGQEFISPDGRPFLAMKTTGLGPRKPEGKLGSILSQPCDPAQVSPSLGLRTWQY